MKGTPNTRGVPPDDVEAIIERHVRAHLQSAAHCLHAAMEPLRERTAYAGSPLLREIEEAHRAASIALRRAEGWRLRVAPQADVFDGEATHGT